MATVYPVNRWNTYTYTIIRTYDYLTECIYQRVVDNDENECGSVSGVTITHERVGTDPLRYKSTVTFHFKATSPEAVAIVMSFETSRSVFITARIGIEMEKWGIWYKNRLYPIDKIQSASTVRTKSMVSEECGINTFEAVIYSEELPDIPVTTMYGEIYAPLGADCIFVDGGTDIRDYVPFAPIELWQRILLGRYYLTGIERVSTNWFKISACSPVGIIDKKIHKGGLYSNKTFVQMLQDILADTIPYSVDSRLRSNTLVVNGWLPYSTVRENLNQLLFAVGAAATYNEDGVMVFKYNEPDVSVDIDDANIYVGGSVDYPTKASKVTMIEHSWIVDNNVEADVLFDNAEGTSVSNALIVFDKPYHSLDGGGLTIDPTLNNANCCRVSGTGTLTGKAYAHIQRELVQEDGTITAEEMRVEDATLVSSLNSLNCLRRVYNYYRNADEVSYDIVSNGAFKCGDLISFQDPFGEMKSGYVKEMDETISGIIKSQTKIATNWQPKYLGNTYEHSMIISAENLVNGTWTPEPSMVGNPAMVVLFSGFGGGSGGYNGTDAENKWFDVDEDDGYGSYIPYAGVGGSGGTSGAYPNYIICEYESLASSYSVAFGQGGAGGSVGGGAGSAGGHSTFGTYDTDINGTQLTGRYINLLTGAIVADKGENGYAGADGGSTTALSSLGSLTASGHDTAYEWETRNPKSANGGNVGAALGGSGCYSGIIEKYSNGHYYNGAGAGGGGAAYGANGGNAMGFYEIFVSRGVSPAHGGNGANAVAPANAVLGKTGDGGHGGGGGGAGGIALGYVGYMTAGNHGGTGGTGSVGGKGSDGFALIYY